MTPHEMDLRAKGERLRARQSQAKAELEAEKIERERLREERAREFWNEINGSSAKVLSWPKKEAR